MRQLRIILLVFVSFWFWFGTINTLVGAYVPEEGKDRAKTVVIATPTVVYVPATNTPAIDPYPVDPYPVSEATPTLRPPEPDDDDEPEPRPTRTPPPLPTLPPREGN